jgi:hypothetical protein
MKISIKFSKIDPSVPTEQPYIHVNINITETNIAPCGDDVVLDTSDGYIPTAKYWDASDPSCISHSMKLFPHVKAKTLGGKMTVNEANFKGLQAWAVCGYRPFVLEIRSNNKPWCKNLFIPAEDVTEAHCVVASAMRRSPSIYLMILTTEDEMSKMYQKLMRHFANQVQYNPLTDILKNPAIQAFTAKNVMEHGERRDIQAKAVYTTETWLDYTIRTGISALEEYRYWSDNNTHSAQAVILPIKETWFPNEEHHLAFALVAKLDVSSKHKPFPQEGDRLAVTIRPDDPDTAHESWSGTVIGQLPATSSGELTFIIKRSTKRTAGSGNFYYVDKRKYLMTFTDAQL